MNKYVVYDIETLKNLITFCFLDYESKKKKEFILFDDINQFYELIKFLKRLKAHKFYLVGYNCNDFDSQILQRVLEISNYEGLTIDYIISTLYEEAQTLIHLPDEEKFRYLVHEKNFYIPHIDVYKQKHYDRPQKATSLKWLEFTMRRPIIKEMPIEHDMLVEKEHIPMVLDYNWEDVQATSDFFGKIMFETDLRFSLSEKFGINLLNAPEPRLAREIFGKYLCEEMKISYYDLKKKNTIRSQIKLKDIIFPYVSFKHDDFNTLLRILKGTTLTPEQKFEYNIDVYGLNCTFALGGLHSNNKPCIVEEDDNHIIVTSDVASMYPNLAIQNDIKPEHLGDNFNKVYDFIYKERKKYHKKDPVNYVYKIVLNSAYGLSAEKNSYLYDVSFTRAICINGELSLLMLTEKVMEAIPEAQIIMLNTDGIEAKIPREKHDLYLQACKEWEETTKLVLEHGQYKKMVIRDVNNYLAIDIKDNVKKKGAFETEMDFHKNPSFLIVPKAIEAYFIHGTDYKKFIQEHEDIYDFMGAVKKKSNFDLNLYSLKLNQLPSGEAFIEFIKQKGWLPYEGGTWIKEQWIDEHLPYEKMAVSLGDLRDRYTTSLIDKEKGQRVTRFYVAKDGKAFFKDFKDGRRVSIMASWLVQTANEIKERNHKKIRENLDYRYYISEVAKTIKEIEGNKQQLQLF